MKKVSRDLKNSALSFAVPEVTFGAYIPRIIISLSPCHLVLRSIAHPGTTIFVSILCQSVSCLLIMIATPPLLVGFSGLAVKHIFIL